MNIRRWLPRRSKDERQEDISFGLWDIGWALCILSVGLAVLLAGVYFEDDAVLGIGFLVGLIGAYATAQSLLGLLVDVSLGMGGLGVLLVVLILVFFAFQIYELWFDAGA